MGWKRRRTDEHVGVEDNSIVKSRSVRCFPEAEAWDAAAIDGIRVRAWETHPPEEVPGERRPSEVIRPEPEPFPTEEVRRMSHEKVPRNLGIQRQDLAEFGFTANCAKCQHILLGAGGRSNIAHSDECRQRIYAEMGTRPLEREKSSKGPGGASESTRNTEQRTAT